ncbi:MAG: TonB-dependent receptor [Shinella sp.]|nr:MAG: TonB-dependent receptor [Shinella sp.]
MRKLFFTASLAAIAASSVPATAQDVASQNETTLAPIVVVTPLRRESALAGTTASVTVIDRETIEKAPTLDLAQFLNSYAGVSVRSNGGFDHSTGVFIRGMSSSRTLVLVNGVRTASATAGSSAWSNFPLESIERIEIVRGPHSAAWGADAIGGVINIITKQGGGCQNGKAVCGSITAGVSHPWGGFTSVDVRGEKDDVSFAFGGNLIGTRGYNITTDPTSWAYEPDDDGFLRGAMNFALARKFDWGKIYTDGLFSRGKGQFDSGSDYRNDAASFAGKVGVRIDHADDWSTTVEVSQGYDWYKSFDENFTGSTSTFATYRTGVLAKTEKSLQTGNFSHVFLLGGEFYHESVETSPTTYAVTERDLSAIFGQYSLENGPWHFDSGIRYDYNEQFGDAVTYNLGSAYDVDPDLTLRTSWGTGFRAPTFNDLYYPYSGGYQGNPDLTPERSRTFEVGLTWQATPDTKVDVAVYRTWLKDAITWSGRTVPVNVDQARVSGVEITASHALSDRFSVNGSIDIKDPRDDTTGGYLVGTDRFKATLGFDFAVTEQFDLGVKGLYGGGTYDTVGADVARLADYVTFDVTAAYKLDKQSSFRFAAENLLDKDYSTANGYRAPGRTVTLSFTRQF